MAFMLRSDISDRVLLGVQGACLIAVTRNHSLLAIFIEDSLECRHDRRLAPLKNWLDILRDVLGDCLPALSGNLC